MGERVCGADSHRVYFGESAGAYRVRNLAMKGTSRQPALIRLMRRIFVLAGLCIAGPVVYGDENGVAGQIVGPNVKPVRNARVVLTDAKERDPIPVRFRTVMGRKFEPIETKTDNYGKFRFPSRDDLTDTAALYVDSPQGYGQSSLEEFRKTGFIRLSPWATLDVHVESEKEPVADVSVTVAHQPTGKHRGKIRPESVQTLTDQNGVAHFDRVMPWPSRITVSTMHVTATTRKAIATDYRTFQIRDGVNKVDIVLDEGARVVGQVVITPDPSGLHEVAFGEGFILYGRDAEGKSTTKQVSVEPNGTFQMTGLPTGQYTYRLPIWSRVPEGHSGGGTKIGASSGVVEIDAEREQPYRLNLPFTWRYRPAVEENAIPFAGKTVTGDLLHSSDYAGKWLLLQAYKTLTPQDSLSRAQKAKAGDIYDSWRAKGINFVEIYSDFAFGGAQLRPPSAPWPVIVDYEHYGTLLARYGIGHFPTHILIDPAGKIVHHGGDLIELAEQLPRLLDRKVLPDPLGPLSGLRSQPIGDADFAANSQVAFAAIFNRSDYYPSLQSDGSHSATKNTDHYRSGLRLYSDKGEVIREIELQTAGELATSWSVTIDPQRDGIYATHADALIAIDRNGRQLWRVRGDYLRSPVVDPKTGDIWCFHGRPNSELVVFDNSGRERFRRAANGRSVRYSAKDDGMWVIGTTLTLLDRAGDVRRGETMPSHLVRPTGPACVDSVGQVWFAAVSKFDPRTKSSRQSLWCLRNDGFHFVKDYGTDDPMKYGITSGQDWIQGLHAIGDQIWVTSMKTEVATDDEFKTERYSTDGIVIVDAMGSLGTLAPTRDGFWLRQQQWASRHGRDGKPSLTIKLQDPLDHLGGVQIDAAGF